MYDQFVGDQQLLRRHKHHVLRGVQRYPQPSTVKSQASTLNLQHSTLSPQPSNFQPSNLKPQTSNLNPQTCNPNPQPSTLNPQPSTLNPQRAVSLGGSARLTETDAPGGARGGIAFATQPTVQVCVPPRAFTTQLFTAGCVVNVTPPLKSDPPARIYNTTYRSRSQHNLPCRFSMRGGMW